MVEDLLSSIEQELYERMEELYPALEECDRLQADLKALEAIVPELPVESEPPAALDIDLLSPGGFESPAALEVEPEPSYKPEPSAALNVDPDPSGIVLRFPANRRTTRTVAVSPQDARPISTLSRPASVPARVPASARVVSPKVARLMLAPRRPALERSGIPRVSAHV
jgi:hypothetical protein